MTCLRGGREWEEGTPPHTGPTPGQLSAEKHAREVAGLNTRAIRALPTLITPSSPFGKSLKPEIAPRRAARMRESLERMPSPSTTEAAAAEAAEGGGWGVSKVEVEGEEEEEAPLLSLSDVAFKDRRGVVRKVFTSVRAASRSGCEGMCQLKSTGGGVILAAAAAALVVVVVVVVVVGVEEEEEG